MIKIILFPGIMLLGLSFISCKKTTCLDYWEKPDCGKPSKNRFLGMYKGMSTLDNGSLVITQWNMSSGPQINEIRLAADFNIKIDAKDPRMFTVKDRSFMGNNLYIREEGSRGFFNGDSVTMEFWMDEGVTPIPGEKLVHYSFSGKRQ